MTIVMAVGSTALANKNTRRASLLTVWAALLALSVFVIGSNARATERPSRERAVELSGLAYEAFLLGDVKKAYSDFTAAEGMFRSRAENAPSDVQAQRDLAVISERLGDLSVRMNEGARARAAYARHLEIIGRLWRADPGSERLLQDLIVGELKIGDIYVWLARAEDAAASYERGVAYCEKLSRIAPENLEVRRNLCLIWYRHGCLLRKAGLGDKAETVRGYEMAAREALLAMDGDKGREDLYLSYKRLGEQYDLVGQKGDSIAVFQESLGLADQLIQADPGNLQYRWELSSVFRKLGELHAQLGQFATAVSAYERVLEIGIQMAEADPGNQELQRDLVVTHYKLGGVLEAGGETDPAVVEYRSALTLAEQLAKARPEDGRLRQDVVEIRKEIDRLSR